MLLKKLSIIASICTLVCSMNTAVSSESNSQLEKIRANEVIRVAVKDDLHILSYQDHKSGIYKGLEPTIANMIAKEIGEDVDVDFITITTSNRENILESDYADCMIGTYTISEERKKKYDISSPYFISNVSVLVNSDSNISSIEDMVGQKIGVIENSNSAKELIKYMVSKGLIDEALFNEETFSEKLWNNQISFVLFESNETILDALDRKEIQGYCSDRIILNSFKDKHRKLISDDFAPQEYGIATRKGSDLSVFIDGLIRKWRDDGTLEKIISENLKQ